MGFVGRERELTRLGAGLERAARGEIQRISLQGPAGIGVTRLLTELESRLADLPEIVVARGAAHEPRSHVPYDALASALRHALSRLPDERLLEVVGPAGYDLAILLPDLAAKLHALGAVPSEPLLSAPDQRGARMAEAALGALERLAGDGVVLLALEELQWADPGTRAFVDSLLRISRRLRLCVVVAHRPDEIHRQHPFHEVASKLTSSRAVDTLVLAPLERHEVVVLLEGLMHERPSAGFVAAVLEGSGGNPLLAEQLVAAHATVEGLRLSDPFEEIVRARMARLSPSAARWLRVLAAARRPLPRPVLLRLALSDGPLARSGLDEAIDGGLAIVPSDGRGRVAPVDGREPGASRPRVAMQERSFAPSAGGGLAGGVASPARIGLSRPDGPPQREVAIVHQRFAEAIEELTLPAERQAIHAALAGSLSEAPAEEAWHWEAAMRFGAAREAHLRAGEYAERIEPGGSALVEYQRALELVDAEARAVDRRAEVATRAPSRAASADPGDGDALRTEPNRGQLLARAAQAAFVAGNFRRAVALVQDAITEQSGGTGGPDSVRHGDVPDPELQLEIGSLYERLGRYRWASGELPAAIDAFRTAVHIVPDAPTRERAHALGALAQYLMLDGRFRESAALAEQARAVARAVGPIALTELGHATCTLGVDIAYGGDLDAGLALLDEAMTLARRAGRLDDLMRTYANITTLLDLDLRREAALGVVQEGIAEARRWGLEAVYGAFLRGNAADCLFHLGRWAESEAECRAGLEWSPSGIAWFSPVMYLALVLVESRSDEEAARIVGQVLLHLESVPEGQWAGLMLRTAASFALWRDDLSDAQRVAERGWKRVLETDDWSQTALAASTTLEVCAAVAESARARRDWAGIAAAGELGQTVLQEARRRVDASGMPLRLGARREAEVHLTVARAHLTRIRGRPEGVVWGRLADEWKAIGNPYEAAKARWWEAAAILQSRGDRGRARDALQEAWRMASALPARPLLRELAGLAQRGRIPLPIAVGEVDADRERVAVGPGLPKETLVPDALLPEVALRSLNDLHPAGVGLSAYPTSGDNGGSGTSTDRLGDRGRISEALLPAIPLPSSNAFGLSPRENEVLAVLAEGRTNREIADRLFISERTVGVHVRKILSKLGVAGRVEAASVAIRLGLVPGLERSLPRR